MIAKKEWFKPRIFGWGLRPVTREGWIYVIVMVLLVGGVANLPIDDIIKVILAGVIMVIFMVDVLIVMFQMYKKLDERERKHQMIIETAASYTAVIAIIMLALYQSFVNDKIDVGVFVVLGAMVIAKIISSFYLMVKG